MLKGLAQWAMVERRNAILAIAATLLVPLLFWLAAALMALAILRHGLKESAHVVLWGSLPALAWLAMGNYSPLLTVLGTSILAVTLRASSDLRSALLSASVIGVVIYFAIPLLMPEVLIEVVTQSEPVLAELFKQTPEVWKTLQPNLGSVLVGTLATAQALVMVLCLLLARSWQAAFYNPGGFSEEFQSLRLPTGYIGSVIILMMLGSSLPPLISNILPILTVPLLIAMAALVHGIVGVKQLDKSWLVAFYIGVLLFGQLLFTLLIFVVLLDSIVDIRGRLKDTTE